MMEKACVILDGKAVRLNCPPLFSYDSLSSCAMVRYEAVQSRANHIALIHNTRSRETADEAAGHEAMRNLLIPYIAADQRNASITFLLDHAARNEACLLDESFSARWMARRQWVSAGDGSPAYGLLTEKYGAAEVPVSVDGECAYRKMSLSAFIEDFIVRTGGTQSTQTGYVKDWHFQSFSQFPEAQPYDLPAFLATDWINNEEWSSNSAENPFGGDYRFLYLGTKGSWTKFHSDVLDSFSWSANIFGRKLWYLLRPGAERYFATTEPASNSLSYVEDVRTRREAWAEAGMMEFIQEPGQIVFVPSGWWHQVHNLDASLSLNHNVINAYNVDKLLVMVESRLRDVEAELSDVKDVCSDKSAFWDTCQQVLFADCRMNVPRLIDFMDLILTSRQGAELHPPALRQRPQAAGSCWDDGDPLHFKLCDNCLSKLKHALVEHCTCQNSMTLCESCSEFQRWLDYHSARRVREKSLRMQESRVSSSSCVNLNAQK